MLSLGSPKVYRSGHRVMFLPRYGSMGSDFFLSYDGGKTFEIRHCNSSRSDGRKFTGTVVNPYDGSRITATSLNMARSYDYDGHTYTITDEMFDVEDIVILPVQPEWSVMDMFQTSDWLILVERDRANSNGYRNVRRVMIGVSGQPMTALELLNIELPRMAVRGAANGPNPDDFATTYHTNRGTLISYPVRMPKHDAAPRYSSWNGRHATRLGGHQFDLDRDANGAVTITLRQPVW